MDGALESGNFQDITALSGVVDATKRGRVASGAADSSSSGFVVGILLPPNPKRVWAVIVNGGPSHCTISLGDPTDSAHDSGQVFLRSGGSLTIDKDHPWTGVVWGSVVITDPPNSISVCEVSLP